LSGLLMEHGFQEKENHQNKMSFHRNRILSKTASSFPIAL